MEPDDLLCSRNARPQKALVGRAQWKIIQSPSLKRERASLEGACIVRCAQKRAALAAPSDRGIGDQKALAQANVAARRASGWAGAKDART